ncbi:MULTISPECIES: leucine-rich repeat domain-containing protein [unclassified Lactococcus]|uniref:leucine-rich repeat domain-containing protein n=1 Tax=unclassified Lactococcus TaxID=2643510 RepID=UPI0011C9C862|nr:MULTISPECIES: leucine-rich repeat domain-containing protein [unclassified Lactococcus]MQW22621.1 leucine-rich repeat protein [Lactococcus sp. dk101]TXK45641.1 leucine-rich repeat domain-containing protein [Lactococcus sp. dk310]TXK51493.1 leucine-rich repeat domain-containing protein [Lactococcus sp. dk322]
MKNRAIMKRRIKIGVSLSLLSLQFCNLSCPYVLSVLTTPTARAATIYSSLTDEAGLVYTIDHSQNTASVTAFVGVAGSAVVIPDQIVEANQTYPVTSVGASAFLNSGISSVLIGNNVTDINTSAFQTTSSATDYYKKALTSVILGNHVQNIKTDAFAGNALSGISFPSALTKIGTRAFANNYFTSIHFGPNVQEIMSKAFQSNTITDLVFDAQSNAVIGSMAFSGSPVKSMQLGNGVVWADDALNKVSPFFDQLADMPLTGVRQVSVSADGSIIKKWLEKDEVNPSELLQNEENIKINEEAAENLDDLEINNQKPPVLLEETATHALANETVNPTTDEIKGYQVIPAFDMKGMLTENQKDDTIQIEEAEKPISLEVPVFAEIIRDDLNDETVEKSDNSASHTAIEPQTPDIRQVHLPKLVYRTSLNNKSLSLEKIKDVAHLQKMKNESIPKAIAAQDPLSTSYEAPKINSRKSNQTSHFAFLELLIGGSIGLMVGLFFKRDK